MKTWKPAVGGLVCTCIVILGTAGEFVRHGDSCWMHGTICIEQPAAPLHATDSGTINIVGSSTST
jgi:hypothetical protein